MLKKYQIYKPSFDEKERNSIWSTLKSNWLVNGPKTLKFENQIKKNLKTKNAIAVNSCTSGLFVALHAIGLKKGDEVITTPLTFVSTIHNLYNYGLKIKLIDINMEDLSIDLDVLKKNISKKTKCILVNHYGGIPAKIDEIIPFCKKKKIKVIEDAATALGAKLGNKKIGSFDNTITVFSLQVNKIITTGEGGIITTNDNKIAKKIRLLASCGRIFQKNSWKYKVPTYGFKFNFTDMQAALGLEQLKKLNKIQKYRRKLRLLYNKQFQNLINKNILKIQNLSYKKKFSEYIYTIILNEKKIKFKRDNLMNFLKKRGIETTVHYIPANKIDFYKKSFKKYKLKNSDYVYKNIISLPFHNKLKSKDIIYISNIINNFINNKIY